MAGRSPSGGHRSAPVHPPHTPGAPHQSDGDVGVVQHALADRAEQQTGEPAPAPRSDHDQIGGLPGCQQRPGRLSLDRTRLELDIRMIRGRAGGRVRDQCPRGTLGLGGVHQQWPEPPVVRRRRAAPRVHGDHPGPGRRRLGERELDRLRGRLRAVDTHHDGRPAGPRLDVLGHDHHRAERMCGHLDADRAQHQTAPATEAARAEHHQTRMRRFADQRRSRILFDECSTHRQPRMLLADGPAESGQCLLAVAAQRLERHHLSLARTHRDDELERLDDP